MYEKIRLQYKLILKKFICIASFCKDCGRDVHDFSAPTEIWNKVSPRENGNGVLCYDCFCERCQKAGLPSVWELNKPL